MSYGMRPSRRMNAWLLCCMTALCLSVANVGGITSSGLAVAARLTASTSGPLAALEADPNVGSAPLLVNFNGAQSYGNHGVIASWVLSFGDGTSDTAGSGAPPAVILHTYSNPGTYIATIVITNRSGLSASATQTVIASASSSAVGGSSGALSISINGANLSDISSTPIPLMPKFSQDNTDYVWYCSSGTNNITVTLTSHGTISSDGQSGSTIAIPVEVVNNQATVIAAPDGQDYWIRCLPSTFPHITVTRPGNPEPGYYLTGTFRSGPKGIPGYPIILNSYGTPIWYLNNLPDSGDNVTLLPSTHTIAWSNHGPYSLYDLDTQSVTWMAPPIDPPDEHELFTDSQGNHWMISTPVLSGYNLSPIGEGRYHKIVDCVVQELNSAGQTIWSWDASKYVSPYETNKLRYVENIQSTKAVDVYHCNSVDVDPENPDDVLISMREVGVFLIDKDTGSILWKLGSTSYPPMDDEPVLSIEGDPEGSIQGQHDARFQPNGDISMLDDHTGLAGPARAVEYSINTTADTATMVWEYASPKGKNSSRMGSVRRYDTNGGTYDEAGSEYLGPIETVVDWGQGAPIAGFTVVDNSGDVLFNADFEKGYVGNRAIFVPLAALNLTELRDTAGTEFP